MDLGFAICAVWYAGHKSLKNYAYNLESLGSVSVGMWQMTSKRVIKVGEQVVKELLGAYSVLFIG